MKFLSNLTPLFVAFHLIVGQAMAAELRGTKDRELTAETPTEEPSPQAPPQGLKAGDMMELSRPTSNGHVGQDALNNESPNLGVNYIIATGGTFPERSGGSQSFGPMMGEIRMFGGNFPPAGWAFCEGQLVSISSNAALFSILGTIYGGDGRTTFGLPDMRGRGTVHPDNDHRLGYRNGERWHMLTNENLPTTSQHVVESIASA